MPSEGMNSFWRGGIENLDKEMEVPHYVLPRLDLTRHITDIHWMIWIIIPNNLDLVILNWPSLSTDRDCR